MKKDPFNSVEFDPILTCKNCKAPMERSGWNPVGDRLVVFKCGTRFLIDDEIWYECSNLSEGGIFFEYSRDDLYIGRLGEKQES